MIYTVIIINTVSIVGDYFNDGNQTEVNRKVYLEPKTLGVQNLIENNFSLAIFSWVPIPKEIGYFRF